MTRRVCVVGWPLAHSRSPIIHRFWLRELGIDGDYTALPVEPPKAEAFFAAFADSGYVGANVTIPHKQVAFAACAELDAVARATGAVNTLWLDGRKLLGANTDASGFLANLDERAPGWDDESGRALVLGAGGGARAIVWALLQRGLGVTVVNRTRAHAETLAAQFAGGIETRDWKEIPALLAATDLLVNTTSLGLRGQPPLDVELSPMPSGAIVSDIVYVPLKTPLLAHAEARGLTAVDGLGMLLHQAAPGFELWFGRRPKVSAALRAAVIADLDRT
jgi:shikimate dehydrogenase